MITLPSGLGLGRPAHGAPRDSAEWRAVTLGPYRNDNAIGRRQPCHGARKKKSSGIAAAALAFIRRV